MHPEWRVRALVDRHPSVGPFVWLSTVQYFVVQLVVASAWTSSYSWRLNAISDLGATRCGQFDDRYVCSPLHGLMNASLVVLGLAMTIGSALVFQEVRRARVGFALMGAAGVGAIMVEIGRASGG